LLRFSNFVQYVRTVCTVLLCGGTYVCTFLFVSIIDVDVPACIRVNHNLVPEHNLVPQLYRVSQNPRILVSTDDFV
jgi:hypothetical protein